MFVFMRASVMTDTIIVSNVTVFIMSRTSVSST